jgi:thymidine phosphorylase
MLLLAGVKKTAFGARARLENSIASGAALEKFRELVTAQGGDARVIDAPAEHLPQARFTAAVAAESGGYVASVDAMGIALAALRLGAGRARAGDAIDHAAGFTQLVKIGERIAPGGTLAVAHASTAEAIAAARENVLRAITFSPEPVATPPLVDEVIGA